MIVVTAAIIENAGLILAARRGKGKHLAGFWEFPGGKLENDESPENCLARELKEEFDVDVSVGAFFDESTHDYGDKVIRLLAYKVTLNSGELKLIDHDKIIWLAPEYLGSVKWAPADIPLVEKYQSALLKEHSVNAEPHCNETGNRG